MKKWLKIGLFLMMIGSLIMFFIQKNQSRQSELAYQEAQQLAQEQTTAPPETETVPPETETVPPETEPEEIIYDVWQEAAVADDPHFAEIQETNLEALRKVNTDVLGWIMIPDTKLSYPLMPGTEGDYYLERTWEKVSSIAGSIFIENLCSDDLTDFNTVIYGHRMNDGSMFASLKYYSEEEYWAEHPYVYIYDDKGAHRYEIFAAYEATLQGSTYQIGFANDEYKQIFLDNCVGYSVIDTGVTPTILDKVITLSTCTGRGYSSRWVVQARLEGEIVQKAESEIEEHDVIQGVHEEVNEAVTESQVEETAEGHSADTEQTKVPAA